MSTERAPPGLRLEVVSGALAGQTFHLSARTTLGRSAGCEVRLDPYEDRQVSGRHAELVLDDGRWLVRDLRSLNGTFLNGSRIDADTPLRHGDVIRLGPDGPNLRATLDGGWPRDVLEETVATELRLGAVGTSEAPAPGKAPLAAPRRWQTVAAVLLVLVAGGAALWANSARARREWERERAALLLRLEEAVAANERAASRFEGQLEAVSDSLRRSTATVVDLLRELERTTRDVGSDRLRGLQGELEEALAKQSELRLAASLDWPMIRELTDASLARVYVERLDGRIESGTAFSVAEQRTMVTAAHLMAGADGTGRPRRIAVQPASTTDVLPAELIALDADSDLALIRVAGSSALRLMELNERLDSVQPGQAIALMGFPLQSAASGDSSIPSARPLASAGILRTVSPDRVEVAGYGAPGASGSPVMDASGSVLGLLRGSIQRNGEQILVAVPATKIIRLLDGQP